MLGNPAFAHEPFLPSLLWKETDRDRDRDDNQNNVWIPTTAATRCQAHNNKSKQQLASYLKSQQGEDEELLRRFFDGICGGTYVEMGALDGVTFSNSYVFATQLQWRGVLVELTRHNYAKLVNNRNADAEIALVQAAVCQHDKEENDETPPRVVHLVEGYEAVSGVWEFASPEFREQWWHNVPAVDDLPAVPCRPMRDLLDDHIAADDARVVVYPPSSASTLNNKNKNNNKRNTKPHYFFDFFSLDVEGSEWSVLQSIDWSRTAFGVVLVEVPHGKKAMSQDEIVTFMDRCGYRFGGVQCHSYWFVNQHFDQIYSSVM